MNVGKLKKTSILKGTLPIQIITTIFLFSHHYCKLIQYEEVTTPSSLTLDPH